MFGFGKSKEYDVRLTEKQMKELTANMSQKERMEKMTDIYIFDSRAEYL